MITALAIFVSTLDEINYQSCFKNNPPEISSIFCWYIFKIIGAIILG